MFSSVLTSLRSDGQQLMTISNSLDPEAVIEGVSDDVLNDVRVGGIVK